MLLNTYRALQESPGGLTVEETMQIVKVTRQKYLLSKKQAERVLCLLLRMGLVHAVSNGSRVLRFSLNGRSNN